MTEVPPFIGEFSNDDVAWVIGNGSQRSYRAREVIIREGVMPEEVFVILEGAVRATSRSMPLLDRILGPGEIAGEISYVNKKPPGATVRADVDSILFCIPRDRLDRKIAEDAGFELRFNRVVSQFSVARLAAWENDKHGDGRIPPGTPLETDRVWELIEAMLLGRFPLTPGQESPPPPPSDEDEGEGGDGEKGAGGKGDEPGGQRPPPSKPPRRRWGSR